jgi:hypothetical protein
MRWHVPEPEKENRSPMTMRDMAIYLAALQSIVKERFAIFPGVDEHCADPVVAERDKVAAAFLECCIWQNPKKDA